MKRNEHKAVTDHTEVKLTRAIKNRERAMAIDVNIFINLLKATISNVRKERITPIPKKIPILFHVPTDVAVRLVKRPKSKTSAPKIIRINKNRESIREEITKA